MVIESKSPILDERCLSSRSLISTSASLLFDLELDAKLCQVFRKLSEAFCKLFLILDNP